MDKQELSKLLYRAIGVMEDEWQIKDDLIRIRQELLEEIEEDEKETERLKKLRKFLFCPSCQNEYSANKGDYWNVHNGHVFKCSYCDEPMVLASWNKELIVHKEKVTVDDLEDQILARR